MRISGVKMSVRKTEQGDLDYDVIRGHAKEALEKIQSRAGGAGKDNSPPPADKRKVGTEWTNRFGKKLVWNGQGWEPK